MILVVGAEHIIVLLLCSDVLFYQPEMNFLCFNVSFSHGKLINEEFHDQNWQGENQSLAHCEFAVFVICDCGHAIKEKVKGASLCVELLAVVRLIGHSSVLA